ncbi:MAG: FtsX-like permease family protein [Spirochaetia bacterium]|nr:FtsX-like permease family protein [Spirochaetia bacterium]
MFLFAIRNLFLQRKRYALMALAVAVGFMLITVLTGLSYGALETIKTKAARYFSGHIIVYGFENTGMSIPDSKSYVDIINHSRLPFRTVSPRSVYYGKEVRLFFGGNYIRLLRVIGADIETEGKELSKLPFTEGGIEGLSGPDGKNGIIISTEASRLLGARMGDDVIIYVKTEGGQYNTENMVVKGIFDETNIFGYAAYMNREELNIIMDKDPGWATEIAVYGKEGSNIPLLTERLRVEFSKTKDVFPAIHTRHDFSEYRSGNRNNDKEVVAVMSVNAQLEQLKSLLDAFLGCTYFVLFIFLVIVMIGILNTYRVIVYERTREIGTMRAIGMQASDVKRIFLYEAAALAIVASAFGFILGLVTFHFVGLFDLSKVTAAGMFTENGKLQYFIGLRSVALNLLFMMAAVVAAAWRPADQASKMPPAQALRKD